MWKLSGRDNKIRQWAELGEFQSIRDAARRVLELENDRAAAILVASGEDTALVVGVKPAE